MKFETDTKKRKNTSKLKNRHPGDILEWKPLKGTAAITRPGKESGGKNGMIG